MTFSLRYLNLLNLFSTKPAFCYCKILTFRGLYRKEIKPLALIKPSDAMSFRKFYNFALKCETFSINTNWNSQETLKTLWMPYNLPGGFRDRRNRKVQCTSWSYARGQSLSDFSEVCKWRSNIGQWPNFLREAVQ